MGRSRRRIAGWVSRWSFLFAIWLLLVDTVATHELVAGGIVAAVAAALTVRLAPGGEPGSERIRPGRMRAVLDPPVRLVLDTRLLLGVLRRRLMSGDPGRGAFRVEPSRTNAGPPPGRLWTEWWGSLTPNRIVVGVDEDADAVLVHELVPGAEEPG